MFCARIEFSLCLVFKICCATMSISSDLEELGHMPEDDLRHFAYTDIEGVKKYFKEREGK